MNKIDKTLTFFYVKYSLLRKNTKYVNWGVLLLDKTAKSGIS